jgi:hypothetical protein
VIPKTNVLLESNRIAGNRGELNGAFQIGFLRIVSSEGMGWDHVSVSCRTRCPTWDEMEMVKKLFFKPDETCMQLHVPETDHINNHQFCLHLWRPQSDEEIALIKLSWGDEWPADYPDRSPGQIPRPPAICV